MQTHQIRRRLLTGFAAGVAALGAIAIYLLHAPTPTFSDSSIEVKELEWDGRQRRYTVFTPSQLRDGASVLFAFHPSQSSGKDMRQMVGNVIERIAEKENVIIVYPDGYEGHFNDCRRVASYSARTLNVDDVSFTTRMIEQLVADKKVDSGRIFALGYSNGGHMALRLALETPEMIRGAAAIAANLPTPDNMGCRMAIKPTRIISFVEGTKDPINPYDGGQVTLFGFGNRGNVLSAQSSAQWFANALGLSASETVTLSSVSDLSTYQQDWISSSAHVRLITIEGGGHTVPQAAYRFPRIFGSTLQSDSVLESIWQQFTESNAKP